MSSLLVSSSVCVVLCLAGTSAAQEAKLGPFNPPNPALQGFLGVPGCGNFLRGGLVWHRSGKIISMESWRSGINPVSLWQPDAKTMRATRSSLLNVGDAWCLSQKGDLLCARSRRMDDQPELDPSKNTMAWTEGAFGCFRIQDGGRVWKLPMRDGESISGAAFTTDDKKVVVLSTWHEQMSLRLLDAATGALLQQHDFPGRSKSLSFDAGRLMMRGGDLWMIHRENDGRVLLKISLSTLQPMRVDCPPLEQMEGRVTLSADVRRMVSQTEFGLTCLELRGGKWDVVFEDFDFRSSPQSEIGDLRHVEFTPDSQKLVMFSVNSARILDFTSKKTHSIKLDENSGGTLSPDGSHLLVEHEHGLRIVSIRETDATQPGRLQQNVWRPHQLRFSEDGKTLLAADAEGIWAWDVATRRPRAWLRSFGHHLSHESIFQTLSLIAKDTEVVAEENDDALRWKLPPATEPPPDKVQMIAPQLAFGGVRQGWKGTYPGVFVNQDSSWILSTNAVQQGSIHAGFGAGSARSISQLFPEVSPQLWFFASDDSFVMHSATTNKWSRLNLPKGTLEELPNTPTIPDPDRRGRFVHPQPVAVLPKRQFVVRQFNDRLCVTSLDGKTQLPWFEAPLRGFGMSNMRAGVSQDEKRCATVMTDVVRRHQHAFVWEIETGKLIGLVSLPTNDATCVALSPDGSLLACGHENTAISIWDVAKLTVPAPSPQPAKASLEPAKSAAAPAPPSAPQGPPPVRESDSRREHMFGSGVWTFFGNGTVSKKDTFPEAGRLRINGKEFEMQRQRLAHPVTLTRLFHAQQDFPAETLPNRADPRFIPLPANKHPEIAAGLIHYAEGSLDDVWISRQTGSPAGRFHQFLTFTDTLTNLSARDKQVEIEFEVRFPAQTQQLVDSSLQPVKTNADGSLQVNPEAIWLAALPAPGTLPNVPIFWFRTPSGGQTCRLQWKPDTHTLIVHHTALLPPGDPRYLAHGVRLEPLSGGVAPDHFKTPFPQDFGEQVVFSAVSRGINYGLPPMEQFQFLQLRGVSKLSDGLGKNADGSLYNPTGIASAHALWLDGAPLSGSDMGVFLHAEDRNVTQPPRETFTFYGTSMDEKVTVSRRPAFSQEQHMSLIRDIFINQEAEPRNAKVAYVSSFSEPIKALYDASGRPVEANATPRAARELGGALIVEFDGPKRPATLLAFYQEGAAAEPKVSWPNPKFLKLEYEVTLPPRQMAEFCHGATEMPLASFDTVTQAFADCLPFQHKAPEKSPVVYLNVR